MNLLRWLLAALIFVALFLGRLLDPAFTNDHFFWLAGGRQILVWGEWPVRDLRDPGYFLQHFASAAAQLIFGYNLLGEALLCVGLIAAGYALTFLLACRAAGSLAIGLVVTAVAITTYPRLYNYHKIVLFVLGLLLCWRYADRRRPLDLVVLALGTVVVGLFRHDYSLYLGAAAGVTILASHLRDQRQVLARRVGLFALLVAVPALAFALFVQVNVGLAYYFGNSSRFIGDEARKTAPRVPPPFTVDLSAPLLAVQARDTGSARVNVRWRSGLSEAQRQDAERRLRLTDGQPASDGAVNRTWVYDLRDLSVENISRLVDHPLVEDTAGIDRSSRRAASATSLPLLEPIWRRFSLPQLAIAPGLIQPANAEPWLYYLFISLPLVGLLTLVLARRQGGSARVSGPITSVQALALVVLCLVANPFLLRDPLQARFADVVAPTAVLAAWLLGRLLAGPKAAAAWPRPWLAGRWLLAAVVVFLTWTSVALVAEGSNWVPIRAMLTRPTAAASQGAQMLAQLRASPPSDSLWPSRETPELLTLARYVGSCTNSPDRAVVLGRFAPEFQFFAGRGRLNHHNFDRQSIPIALMDPEGWASSSQERVLPPYFRLARESTFGGTRLWRVYVDDRLTPTSTYGPLDLPCFAL